MSEEKHTSDDEFWNRVKREKPVNDLQAAKSGAQQLVAITSILQGVLVAMLPLEDFKPLLPGWKVLLLIAPSLLWLISLIFSVLVFTPEKSSVMNKEDSRHLRKVYTRVAASKVRKLKTAQLFLVLGLVALIVVLSFYFLRTPPTHPSSPTKQDSEALL